jgi:hypothetical protein
MKIYYKSKPRLITITPTNNNNIDAVAIPETGGVGVFVLEIPPVTVTPPFEPVLICVEPDVMVGLAPELPVGPFELPVGLNQLEHQN